MRVYVIHKSNTNFLLLVCFHVEQMPFRVFISAALINEKVEQ